MLLYHYLQGRPPHYHFARKKNFDFDAKLDQVYSAWLIKWVVKRGIIQLAELCLTRNIPPLTEKYGLRNQFRPLESGFLMRKSEEKGDNFLGSKRRTLKFTYSSNLAKTESLLIFVEQKLSSGPMWQ